MRASPSLTAEEVCNIIKTCSQNRVTSISYLGLDIKFDALPHATRTPHVQETFDQPEGGETPSGNGQRSSEEVSRLVLSEEDELLMEEVRLAQLMTDDPLAYEQEMVDANLYPRVTNGSGQESGRTQPDL